MSNKIYVTLFSLFVCGLLVPTAQSFLQFLILHSWNSIYTNNMISNDFGLQLSKLRSKNNVPSGVRRVCCCYPNSVRQLTDVCSASGRAHLSTAASTVWICACKSTNGGLQKAAACSCSRPGGYGELAATPLIRTSMPSP